MEQGLAAGLTPPKITLRDVPDQVQAQIVDDPLKSPMLDGVHDVADGDRRGRPRGSDGARRPRRTSRQWRPAFTELHDFLTTRYLPACRETIAASALPNGAAMYAYNVELAHDDRRTRRRRSTRSGSPR